MNVEYTHEGTKINKILINDKIFQEEKIGYTLRDREQQIDDLIDWISESESESDKYLMKEDLRYLMKLEDEYIFSSISTNEYIARSDNAEEFNKICKEILELNKSLKTKKTIPTSTKGKKGWKSESARHALARKGIKTGRKGKESEAVKDWDKMVKKIKTTPIYTQEEMRTTGLKPFTVSKLKKARKGEF